MTAVPGQYMIEKAPDGRFEVYNVVTGTYLLDHTGKVRSFTSRAVARKRISRERKGNFHA